LGNSEAVPGVARGDLDVNMDYLAGAEYPYDHTMGHY